MKTYLVTATPPTTNGDLHVGHLSGPYLAGDVFVRYQKLQGNQAVYLCSGDDNQTYVVTTAKRRKIQPDQMVKHYAKVVKSTLAAANIQMDAFTSSLENEPHRRFVQAFFLSLYKQGILKEKVQKAYYCSHCETYLMESFAKGRCPYCGEGAAGNLCEACGRVNDPTQLHDVVCSACQSKPSLVEYKGLFFPLDAYRKELAEFYATRASWRPHLQALCQWLVSQPIPDYPVTYPARWGIPVPLDGYEGQVINVWFEMYPGHIATTRMWAARQDDPDLADQLWQGKAVLVQFLGYDNSFFNAVLHVAMGMAANHKYLLPEHIITNEFYLLDGEKFSTSRNHAIWGSEILQTGDADALRFYLSRTNPEHMQTSFSLNDFRIRTEQVLGGLWSDTLNRFLRCIGAGFSGQISVETNLDLVARGLFGWAKVNLERFYSVEQFSLRFAAETLVAYMEGCADYLKRSVLPAEEGSQLLYRQRVASLGFLLRGLAFFAAPLMPQFAQQLWRALGYAGEISDQTWSDLEAPAAPAMRVEDVQEWFTRAESLLSPRES